MKTQLKPTSFTLPPGKWWVGDLCYIVPDGEWNDLCEALEKQGYDLCQGELESGAQWVCSTTMWGDGAYQGSDGNVYGVDAGLIGALQMPDEEDLGWRNDGCVHKFKQPFEFRGAHGKNYRRDWDGVIHIGHIEIRTDD